MKQTCLYYNYYTKNERKGQPQDEQQALTRRREFLSSEKSRVVSACCVCEIQNTMCGAEKLKNKKFNKNKEKSLRQHYDVLSIYY